MHVAFVKDWRGYKEGYTGDVPASQARSALSAGAAVHLSDYDRPDPETASRGGAPETAALRTSASPGRDQVCGARLSSGGYCKRETGGGCCWQHEGEE